MNYQQIPYHLSLFLSAEVDGHSLFNIKNPSLDYSDIIDNPYLYSNLSYALTGTVQKTIANYDKGYVQNAYF